MNAETSLRPRLVREFEYDAPLASCVFDRTGRFAFTGAWDRNLVRWNLETGEKVVVPDQASWIIALDVSTSNRVLVSGDHVGHLVCWSLEGDAPRPLWQAEAHRGPTKAVALSADGRWIASGGADGTVRLWDVEGQTATRTWSSFVDHVEAVAFSPDGRHLIATGRDCKIRGWTLTDGAQAFELSADGLRALNVTQDIQYGGGRSLAYDRAGAILACAGRAGYARPASLLFYDVASGRQTRQVTSPLSDSIYYAIEFHPSGCLVAFGSSISAGELAVWQPEQDRPLATLATSNPGLDMALSVDGRRAIVALCRGRQRTYPEGGALALYDLEPSS